MGGKLSERVALVEDKLEYEGEINFKYDASVLQDPATFKTLGEVRDILKEHGAVKIHIEGHADSRGDDEYNRKLSDARAGAILRWLGENGIAAGRLTSKGYGADKSKEPSRCRDKTGPDSAFKGDEECIAAWRKNRRTVLRVVGGLETLKAPTEAASPRQRAAESVPQPEVVCPLRVGGHLNLLGPAVHASVAFAVQPVCPVELSAGVGLKLDSGYAFGGEVGPHKDARVPTLFARAKLWFLPEHSPVVELTAGGFFSSTSTFGYGALAGGYGYRSSGPFRFTAMIGALFPPSRMGTSPSAFGEASLGLLW